MTIDVSFLGVQEAPTIQVAGMRLELGEPPPPDPGFIHVGGMYVFPDPDFEPPAQPGVIPARWDGTRLVRLSGFGVWDGTQIVRQDV